MIVLDYGKPSVDTWWTRMVYTGTHLAWVVNGHANNALASVSAHRQVANDDEMVGILDSVAATTECPSTFTGNPRLMQAWAEAQARN